MSGRKGRRRWDGEVKEEVGAGGKEPGCVEKKKKSTFVGGGGGAVQWEAVRQTAWPQATVVR